MYKQCTNECASIIQDLFYSEDEKSREAGAYVATVIFIKERDNIEVPEGLIFNKKLFAEHINGCSRVAIELMEKRSLHDKAKTVLKELLTYPDLPEHILSSIFYHSRVILLQDIDIVKSVIAFSPNESYLPLSDYLERNDISGSDYTEIVLHLCNQYTICKNKEGMGKGGYYSVISKLPVLVAKLYDRAGDNESLRIKCLDMWNNLYQSDFIDIQSLTQHILEY